MELRIKAAVCAVLSVALHSRCSSLTLTIPTSPVFVRVGGDVTLNFLLNPSNAVLQAVTWTVNITNNVVIWTGGAVSYGVGYEGRAHLNTMTGSLTHFRLTQRDTGQYNVSIITTEGVTASGSVTLQVLEVTTAVTSCQSKMELRMKATVCAVLSVALHSRYSSLTLTIPTSPVFGWVGGVVTLNLSLNPSNAVLQAVTWRLNITNNVVIWTGGAVSYGVGYEGRAHLNTMTGSMSLFRLTLRDTGQYSVSIITTEGVTASGSVALQVLASSPGDHLFILTTESLAGTIISSFLGGVLVSVIAFLIANSIRRGPLCRKVPDVKADINEHPPSTYENMHNMKTMDKGPSLPSPSTDHHYMGLQPGKQSIYHSLQGKMAA